MLPFRPTMLQLRPVMLPFRPIIFRQPFRIALPGQRRIRIPPAVLPPVFRHVDALKR